MNKTHCKKVFTNLKRASRKFNVKNFGKKNGLVNFYSLAEKQNNNNKNIFKALKKASKKVKPYKSVTKKGLRKFFINAKKNLKNKTCKNVLTSMVNATNKSKSGKVTNKKLLSFYKRAENIYSS
tara:strand:+ start:9196 stop:9567 length:372 start_codon:yes stop_codon:yes gene_type:complete